MSGSHGVVVNEIVERESMEYNLGGNTISVVFYGFVSMIAAETCFKESSSGID